MGRLFASRIGTRMIGVAAFMGLAVLLGGCNSVDKNEHAAVLQENEGLRTKNAQLEQNLQNEQKARADAENTVRTLQQAQVQPAPPIDTGGGGGGGRSERSARSQQTTTVGKVFFGSGSTSITPDMKKELDRVASQLKSQYRGAEVRCEGHADGAPPTKGKYKTNDALSEARAQAVKSYLAGKGISASRIEVVGMGSTSSGKSKEGRRVDIVVVGG